MATIRLATAAAIRSFYNLTAALEKDPASLGRVIDKGALEDELGRFRVWSGNLGALQKGHSSADYRLRDSPLLSSNALKLLQELHENLTESTAVITGVRLPYEQQERPSDTDQDDHDSFYSEDEDDDSDDGAPKTELDQRFREIVDIIDNLYKLSVRIRLPTLRTRSLKAAAYQPKDPDTGVDILEQYAVFDLQHTKELVAQLREPYDKDPKNDNDFLIDRLSKAITLRRRQFKYWRRHRDKLGQTSLSEDAPLVVPTAPQRPVEMNRQDTLEVHLGEPMTTLPKAAASEKTGKTLLSGTEATHHHQSLDDMVDSKSVTSYATTVRDVSGRGIELPPPPKAADGEKDFECPYCFIICPARYGRGRPWRTHLLQDLQPYICTYPDCESSDVLFRSRREWSEHEASHRKAWRCPEHPAAVFKSRTGLEEHLRCEHSDNFPQRQLDSIVKVGETSTVDMRDNCPVCLVDAHTEGLGDLQNHIAHHLERLASFALPILARDDDSDGGSSAASRGGSISAGSSQDLTDSISRSSSLQSSLQSETPSVPDFEPGVQSTTHIRGLLSAEAVGNLPDASEKRMDLLFPSTTQEDESNQDDSQKSGSRKHEYMAETDAFRSYIQTLPGAKSVRFYRRYGLWEGRVSFHTQSSAADALERFDRTRYPKVVLKGPTEKNNTSLRFRLPATEKIEISSRPRTPDDVASESSQSLDYNEDTESREKRPVLAWRDLPTLRTLYTSRVLLQRDQSFAPDASYNQIISLCQYDITRLRLDCIVNSANKALKVTRTPDSLNHYIHRVAGPSLLEECKKIGRISPGDVRLTRGYNLPCRYVIHAARPSYGGPIGGPGEFNVLSECYRGALQLAMDTGITTIAFPSLGAGGCGFPSRVAARIALQEVREFLDSHKNHKFERIVFCVFSGLDDRAYKDFLPVFFPPTYRDLESAQYLDADTDHSDLVKEIQSVVGQVNAIVEHVPRFANSVPEFPSEMSDDLTSIASVLQSINVVLMEGGWEGNLTTLIRADIVLACSTLQTLLESFTEHLQAHYRTDIVHSQEPLPDAEYKVLWDDFNFHLHTKHHMTMSQLLQTCSNFVEIVSAMLKGEDHVPYHLNSQRSRLNSYLTAARGFNEEVSQDYVDLVMHAREYQRQDARDRKDIVKIHEIPSLLQLYESEQLEAKPTNAIPSTRELSTVCIFRQDITCLEVDVLVNSTDPGFAGMGTLDRTVFRKGGLSMREDCKNFGPCKAGDVKISPGYLLPAKYVIHAIPPETHSKHTKDILRKLYRDILFTASNTLKATSIAIPAIGTGTLGNPVRDCAALALEEVKRFLETTDASNTIRKIVLCVFGSNDEAIYKGLAPIYFPPLTINIGKALPEEGSSSASQIDQRASTPSEPGESSPSKPKRTLFKSIGEAFRGVRLGMQSTQTPSSVPPAVSSAQRWLEMDAQTFEEHARRCPTCNLVRTYDSVTSLCTEGSSITRNILDNSYMMDETIYAHAEWAGTGTDVKVELPPNYRRTRELLALAESQRKLLSVYPGEVFASATGNSEEAPPPGATIHTADVTVPYIRKEGDAIATVLTWSAETKQLLALSADECDVRISLGRADIYEMDPQTHKLVLLLALQLGPETAMIKSGTLGVVLKTRVLPESKVMTEDDIVLESRSPKDCDSLFQRLKAARKTNMTSPAQQKLAESTLSFKCDVPGCAHSDVPFVSLQSLECHHRTVHEIERPTDSYMCAAENCAVRNHIWHGLDNFKEHIASRHKDENEQDLIRRSKRNVISVKPGDTVITGIHSWNFVSFEWERYFPGQCTVVIDRDELSIVDLREGKALNLRLSPEPTEILREPDALHVTVTGVDLGTEETKHLRLESPSPEGSEELYRSIHQACLGSQGFKDEASQTFPDSHSRDGHVVDTGRSIRVKRLRKWNADNGRWADQWPMSALVYIARVSAGKLVIDFPMRGPESSIRLDFSSAPTGIGRNDGSADVYLYQPGTRTMTKYVIQCSTLQDAEELYRAMCAERAAGFQTPDLDHDPASALSFEQKALEDLPSAPSHEPQQSSAGPTPMASDHNNSPGSKSNTEPEPATEDPSSPIDILAETILLQLESVGNKPYQPRGLHEDELAAHLGVGPDKLRRALQYLEQQGKVFKAIDDTTRAYEPIWAKTMQNPRPVSRRPSDVDRSSLAIDDFGDSVTYGDEESSETQPSEGV